MFDINGELDPSIALRPLTRRASGLAKTSLILAYSVAYAMIGFMRRALYFKFVDGLLL